MQALMDQVALMPDSTSDGSVVEASRADDAMDRYACGDDAAFTVLYDELAPRLYGFALRWTRSRSAAEDTVQQTLLQIHASRHRFLRGAAVMPWAYAIARRLLIDLGRRDGREELRDRDVADRDEPTTTPAPDEALHRRRVDAEARRDLESLPPSWREAFELVKFEELSVGEAAEVLGISTGAVKVRVHRATAALRDAVAGRLAGFAEHSSRSTACGPGPEHPERGLRP